jgi:hypothetical protein
METLLAALAAGALFAATEVLLARLLERWMAVAPAAQPLGFVSA